MFFLYQLWYKGALYKGHILNMCLKKIFWNETNYKSYIQNKQVKVKPFLYV